MTAFALALLAGAAGPPEFHVEILSDDAPKPAATVLRNVPTTVRITALDPSFSGEVEVSGIRNIGRVRIESGTALLENAVVEGPIRVGDTSTDVRILPPALAIVPPLLAIVLAFWTRQVLVALLAGVFAGAMLIHPSAGLLRTFDHYIVGALADRSHIQVVIFTVALGGMVGVMARSGGTRGLAETIARLARGPRSAQVATSSLGIAFFFDDYANCLVVGNTMRPFTDRLRISREKLSFLVDATAAPVATIAVISTWVGYQLGELGHVDFVGKNPYEFFLRMIPYSFYSVFLLLFVLLIAVTGRDFGPMAHAERRARRTGEVLRPGAQPLVGAELEATSERSDPLAGIAPVAAVIAFVLAGLYFSGRANAPPGALLREIVAAADSFAVLIWASFGGGLVAILLALARRSMRIGEVADAYASGCKAMVMAVLVLTLAWAISRVCRELDLGPWIASLLNAKALKAVLPAAVFLAAAVISFATGTSWGTMAILIPIAGSLAGQLGGTPGHVHVATLAAVLTGAIFGDHCSPISDTTVLSSIASGADHVDHVRTQLPYAVTIAAIAFAAFLAVGYGAPVGAVLGAGAVFVAATVVLVARPAE